MNAFWQIRDSEVHEADPRDSEEKVLSPDDAEAILTGLANTYLNESAAVPGPLHHLFERLDQRPVSEAQLPNLEAEYRALLEQLPAVVFVAYLDLLKNIRTRHPDLPVLILSMHDESIYAERALRAGGKASRRLVEDLFAPLLYGASREAVGDAAHLSVGGAQIAITTDSFVVKPLSFPGGPIGELAVNGTVNDLAVSGARAEALVVTYVLEAGLPTAVLEAEVRAMATAARKAGVKIADGDTKVVEHGKADHMYITTTGIGSPIHGMKIDPRSVRCGDKVLLSGPIGGHGITILLARGELDIEAELRSDTRSVLPLVEALAFAAGPGIRWMATPPGAELLLH